jgi:hypothetical protein
MSTDDLITKLENFRYGDPVSPEGEAHNNALEYAINCIRQHEQQKIQTTPLCKHPYAECMQTITPETLNLKTAMQQAIDFAEHVLQARTVEINPSLAGWIEKWKAALNEPREIPGNASDGLIRVIQAMTDAERFQINDEVSKVLRPAMSILSDILRDMHAPKQGAQQHSESDYHRGFNDGLKGATLASTFISAKQEAPPASDITGNEREDMIRTMREYVRNQPQCVAMPLTDIEHLMATALCALRDRGYLKRDTSWVPVADEDVEVAIAEAIAVIEPRTDYCEKGIPILADLKKYGWSVMQRNSIEVEK